MHLPRRLPWILGFAAVLSACGSNSGSGSTQSGSAGGLAGLTQLKAVHPYGDPMCMALSPNQKLAFVSEGASLAVLDIGSSTPGSAVCLKTRLPVDVSCFALVPAAQSVFLCGGKLGLFELATCTGLGDSCATQCASYPLVPIDRVDDKLCIAAAVVHSHSAGGLIVALYSAQDASELRMYDLAPPHALRAVAGVQGGSSSQGLALAFDPLDPNRLYAALGSGGLVRVDIGDMDHIVVEQGPIFDQPDQVLYGKPARAFDLALAGGFLYAAIDKGGLVEIDLAEPWAQDMVYDSQVLGCGPQSAAYAYRVAALADGTGRVLIAVGTHQSPAQEIDGGPYSLVGAWDFALGIGNVPAAQPGDPHGCDPALFLFEHRATAPGADTGAGCAPSVLCPIAFLSASSESWRSMALRRQGADFQLCECRRNGFRLMDLGPDPFSSATLSYSLLGSHSSTGIAPVAGVASLLDPDLLYLTDDSAGSDFAGMAKVSADESAIGIVPNTNGLCTQSPNEAEYCDSPEPAVDVPTPYKNGFFCSAHWIDPSDSEREWFVAGEGAIYEQCTPPCEYSDQGCQSSWKAPQTAEPPRPGWKVVSFLPGVGDGARWQLRWWQIPSPLEVGQNSGRNYLGSSNDPRPDSALVHLTRSGTINGYLVCDRNEIMASAQAQCSVNNGRGQLLDVHFLHVLPTHLEFAGPNNGGCIPPAGLSLTLSCTVFPVNAGGTTHWVAGLTAGYAANPCASGDWQPYYQRAMVVFYDVTDVDANTPPTLLRLAFGPAGTQGNAFAMTVQEVDGRTCAYVADVGGRLLVFDVSGDVLYPVPSNPEQPATGLAPSAVWTCPVNTYDGFRDNVLDVAIVPPHAYLATGRRGLTILDVASNPHEPHEIEASPILTPGLALGLILRQTDASTTLVVGDSRGGLRLYGKPSH
jgi:hypothetical protein